MASYMEQAKVMSKGQITIPKEIREKLSLNEGDKVTFIVHDNQVILENSLTCALKIIQFDMKDQAKRVGIKSDEDVVALVKKIRK